VDSAVGATACGERAGGARRGGALFPAAADQRADLRLAHRPGRPRLYADRRHHRSDQSRLRRYLQARRRLIPPQCHRGPASDAAGHRRLQRPQRPRRFPPVALREPADAADRLDRRLDDAAGLRLHHRRCPRSLGHGPPARRFRAGCDRRLQPLRQLVADSDRRGDSPAHHAAVAGLDADLGRGGGGGGDGWHHCSASMSTA
jgi:hypothetical protein